MKLHDRTGLSEPIVVVRHTRGGFRGKQMLGAVSTAREVSLEMKPSRRINSMGSTKLVFVLEKPF